MDEEVVVEDAPTAIDVKIDETIFNNLEQNMSEFIETVKEKELVETGRSEKLDELLEKMIKNEETAIEKALLDEEAELVAKQLAEEEALIVEEIDPDAVDLATLYKLLQQKMKDDAEAFNSFEYLTCIKEVANEAEQTEDIEDLMKLMPALKLNNEKLDVLIEQNNLITFYGYIVIPGLLVSFFFYKFLKWFT